MKSIWIPMLFSAFAFAGEPQNFVNVTGWGKLRVSPDQAEIHCGVSKLHKRVDSAVARSSRVSNAILEIAAKYGVAKADIGTRSSEVKKEYRNSRDTSTYIGINSEHIYTIKLRKIDSVSRFVNEMYARGMNELEDIEFSFAKEDSVKRVATELAMLDALANAKAMVKNQGREIGKLISASYEKPEDFEIRVRGSIDDLLGGLWGNDSGGEGKVIPEYLKIIPGQIDIEVQVYAKYEIK